MTATLDTNVLVYGFLEPWTEKGEVALSLIERTSVSGVLTVQACGELLAVTRRKDPDVTP